MADVIITGGGPAGCSAAWSCVRAGLEVLLITSSLDTVCLAHGPEVELAADTCGLFTELGLSGRLPSRELHRQVKWLLEQQPGLHLLQADVSAMLVEEGRASGVRTWEGPEFRAPLLLLCAGSFLQARLRSGELDEAAGRPGQMSYADLALDLQVHGVQLQEHAYTFELAGQPAVVESLIISQESLQDGLWLRELPGAAAAGYCADPELDFTAAARCGESAGSALVAQSRAVSSTGRT